MIVAILSVGALALIFGLGLAYAHKKLAVEKDPRIEEIEEILPSANCGACGYPGCTGYAVGLIEEDIAIDLCPPGGSKLIKKLGIMLGKEAAEGEKMVARVLCSGDLDSARQKYVYNGITDCNQAVAMFGGSKVCDYGCVGLGSCVRACAFDAIDISKNLDVVVNEPKCTGCTLCVPVCPKDIIKMVPARTQIFNSCSSLDKAGPVKKYCNVGCTACKLCEKACEHDAIHVVDNLAVFTYDKCTECNDCTIVCPTDSIQSWMPEEIMSDRAKAGLAELARIKLEGPKPKAGKDKAEEKEEVEAS
ncbi:MAG: RnfABCDGE type electron transport complex subunit B [Spirochaetota bacterium]|nr:RnfABCDGE type electron transport complex subunit B [Spirochaetota bacterium]